LNGNVLFICADTIEFMIGEMLRSEWSYLCTILTELDFHWGPPLYGLIFLFVHRCDSIFKQTELTSYKLPPIL